MKLLKGKPVIYQNGNRFELGIIKTVRDEKNAWINYHAGDIAALTNVDNLHEIANIYAFEILRKQTKVKLWKVIYSNIETQNGVHTLNSYIFKTYEEAKVKYRNLIEIARQDFKESQTEYIEEETDNEYIIYEDGYYSQNNLNVIIQEEEIII